MKKNSKKIMEEIMNLLSSLRKKIDAKKLALKYKLVDAVVNRTCKFLYENHSQIQKVGNQMKRIFGPMSERRKKWIKDKVLNISMHLFRHYKIRAFNRVIHKLLPITEIIKGSKVNIKITIEIKGITIYRAIVSFYKKIKRLKEILKPNIVIVETVKISYLKCLLNIFLKISRSMGETVIYLT
jgi:hypothetical protein